MRFLLLFLSIFLFIGCQNQKELSPQSVTESIQVFTDSLNTMSFEASKNSFVQDGFYTFSSKEMNAKISLEKLVSEDLGSVFSKEELIDRYKKGLNNAVVESKDDWFIVKGIDSKKNVEIIKGVYSYADRLLSEEENPEGGDKYILLTTYAWVIKVEYPQNNSEKMNLFSKDILDSFIINYDNF